MKLLIRKISISLLYIFLMLQFVCAQSPTPADIQKKVDSLTNDPKLKAMMEKFQNAGKQPAVVPDNNSIKIPDSKSVLLKPDNRQLPSRNNILLSQLPKKILTSNELGTYLLTLNAQLVQKIKSSSADSANVTIKQLGNDGENIAYAAIVAWYKNDAESAVLLASKAATLSINNDAALSNCAAIFIMAGLQNKAIPILKVLLQREPNSSTVLNNIGQAYAGLGEPDTAMYYFGRCIKIAPEHPEANNTAAIICTKKGQTELAKGYCEQSLKGGLTSEAIKTYGHLFKEDNVEKLIDTDPWKIYPFNENDFTFPEQCEKVEDAARIKAELDACKSKYKAFFTKYDKGHSDEMRGKAAKMSAEYAKNPAGNLWMVNAETPYTKRAAYVYHRISTQLLADIYDVVDKHSKAINNLKTEYEGKKKELGAKRDKEFEACDGHNGCEVKVDVAYCRKQNELSNEYLPRFAVINRDYVSKRWRMAKEFFQANSVLLRMGIKHNTIQYYSEEAGRIGIIASPLINGEILTSGYEIIQPYCDMTEAEMKRIDSLDLTENADCKLNVKIPLGLVKLTFKCDEFELEGGELIKAKYNKNFRSGQTTLYAGVGGSIPFGIPGFKAGATQYIFVCFDKNNQPVDVGTLGELKLSAPGVSEKIILRTSLNTGVSFEPGPLKPLADVLTYLFK
ncbi:MAG: hypothetical protein ABI480_08255 [Chitinophagaceae bacterium]